MVNEAPAGGETPAAEAVATVSGWDRALDWSSRNARFLAPLVTLIAMFVFFSLATDVFLTVQNLQNDYFFPELITHNAQLVYDNDQYLNYVDIVERSDYTTVVYKDKDNLTIELNLISITGILSIQSSATSLPPMWIQIIIIQPILHLIATMVYRHQRVSSGGSGYFILMILTILY